MLRARTKGEITKDAVQIPFDYFEIAQLLS